MSSRNCAHQWEPWHEARRCVLCNLLAPRPPEPVAEQTEDAPITTGAILKKLAELDPARTTTIRALGRLIEDVFNKNATTDEEKVGFCLITFDFGGGGQTSYISNADRDGVRDLFLELIEQWRTPESRN